MKFFETSRKRPNGVLFVKKICLELWECIIIIAIIISTDDDPSLRIESFAMVNLQCCFHKIIF